MQFCLVNSSVWNVNLTFFFFFKQKTAYEMRISDWSSDVCSSDLAQRLLAGQACQLQPPVGNLNEPAVGFPAPGELRIHFDRVMEMFRPLTNELKFGMLLRHIQQRDDPAGVRPDGGSVERSDPHPPIAARRNIEPKCARLDSDYAMRAVSGDRKSTRLNSSH